MNLPAIRCIFLDLGRTLVDLNLGHLAERMRILTGLGPEDLKKAVADDGLATAFETGLIAEDTFHEQVCNRLGRRVGHDEFFAAWNSIFEPEPILPDDLLAHLAQKARLWALSNTNSAHYRFIAERYSFFRYFSGKVLSFEVGLQKPDARIFERALELAAVTADEALFVDDHLPNVESARSVGIDAFQFTTPAQFILEMKSRQLLSIDD